MEIEPLSTAPKESDFQSLSDYQSTTPASFFDGPTVLHHHSTLSTLSALRSSLLLHPALSSLSPPSPPTNGSHPSDDAVTLEVEIFTTSAALLIFSPSSSKGVRIPYRAISLHARQSTSLFLQLSLDDPRRVSDADLRVVDMTITPAGGEVEVEGMYDALSACADLHPDPAEDGEGPEDDDLGSGGWITAESLAAEGGLGPGAGTRRGLEDDGEGEDEGEGEGETKWHRTE